MEWTDRRVARFACLGKRPAHARVPLRSVLRPGLKEKEDAEKKVRFSPIESPAGTDKGGNNGSMAAGKQPAQRGHCRNGHQFMEE